VDTGWKRDERDRIKHAGTEVNLADPFGRITVVDRLP
jgi:hypothetical protein